MEINSGDSSLEEQPSEGPGRRGVLHTLGAGPASAALIGAVAAGGLTLGSVPVEAQTLTDSDILNFALNLEYLEAEFYLRAFFGYGLQGSDVTGLGTQGIVTGGAQVPFRSPTIQQYCQLLAVDELTHVRFLKAALGTSAVAEPSIDLFTSFTVLAIRAGLIQVGQTFNPFADDVSFLLGAFIFEDVGVTAYNGAISLISNSKYLQAAASILAVEAYHAGIIRTLLANIGAGVAANAISALRAVDGGGNESPLTVPGQNYNAVAADSNALAFRRTPTQVLNIVYGASTACSRTLGILNCSGTPGGFFPTGLNGTIR